MKKYIIISAVLFLFSCSEQNPTSDNSEEETAVEASQIVFTEAQIKTSGIKTDTLHYQDLSGLLRLNGKIEVPPQNQVSVSVPLGGYLKSTSLLPGMLIRKGQIIAVLEDPVYIQIQQDYLTAKIKLRQLEYEYLRQQELNKDKSGSDKNFQQAESDFFSQKISVKALSEKLLLLGIKSQNLDESNLSRTVSVPSPIEGYVAKVNANIGKYISSGDVLFELVDISDIHLNVKVFEQDLAKVKIGQKVFAYTQFNPEKKYPAEVILTGHSLNPDKSTEVHCHFDQYDPALVPGMYMNAEVEVQKHHTASISEAAFVRFENKDFIFESLPNNSFRMLPVTQGVCENGYCEVISPEDISRKKFVTEGAHWVLMKLNNTEE